MGKAVFFGLIGCVLLPAAAPPPGERVIVGDGVTDVTIDGAQGRMRIDPGALGMPLITMDWAARAKLKPGPFGIGYGVGPQTIAGRTAIARIDFGGGPQRHRIGWTERAYAAGLDGVVGPDFLPEPIVRFALRDPRPGERTVALPMVDGGGLFGGFGGLFATIDIDGEPIRVRFDPWHPRSLATAGAAQRIAGARDGQLSGTTARVEIAFGIERPVRTMTLARPIAFGPLTIATIGVRTSDYGTVGAIRDADADPDPDEIVVSDKKKRDRGRDRVTIGADLLDRCSAIVFDKPAKQIRLTCG